MGGDPGGEPAPEESPNAEHEREAAAESGPADAGTGHGEGAPASSEAPPRGPPLRRIAGWLLLAMVLLATGHAGGDALLGALGRVRAALTSDKDAATDSAEAGTFYTCGMHPWVILPRPGNCPICHMVLTPLDPAKFTGEITIDPVVTQNIGVRIAPVVSGPLTRLLRTVGKIDYDETGVRDVNTRIDGWVEKLYVDSTGARVEQGQPLFEVFSRELYSAQEEFLAAVRAARSATPEVGFVPQVARDTRQDLEAARRRLQLFGIDDEQITHLESDGEVSATMTIKSPWSGLVTEKHAFDGMRITPGMLTYRIADLSRVWVFVTLYEYQLPFVHVGQAAVMTLPYIPGQRFEGQVAYVYPWLEERTREVRVRVEFDNPGLLLKPGMFATVELQGLLAGDRTLAPREAVIDTGQRQVAFVSHGSGRFEPREVRVGVQAGDGMLEILSGLRPGELVVTSGQFLLDSEARIREALAKMIRGELASDQERAAVLAGASELESLPDAVASALSALLEDYLAIGTRLAGDSVEGVAGAARALGERVDELLGQAIPERPHFWHEHDEIARVRGAALQLAQASELADARLRFGDLSVALSTLVRATGVPPGFAGEVRELHCPMFREGQGGSIWLQRAGDVRNPYFGAVMLGCFDEATTLPVTGPASSGGGAGR